MKKMARRGLSLVLSLFMVFSLAFTDLSFVSYAEEANHIWTRVSLSDITSGDSIAITMTTSDGETYVLPATSTSKAPAAVLGTVDGSSLTIADGSDKDYAWSITKHTVEEKVVNNTENNTEAEVASAEKLESDSSEEATKDSSEETVSEEKPASEKVEEKATEEKKSEEEVKSTEDSSKKEASKDDSKDDTSKKDEEESKEEVDEKKLSEEEEAEKALKEKEEKEKAEKEKAEKEKEEEETVTRTYYTISNGSDYLYTTAANNGVRVGDMPKEQVGAQWELSEGYLSAKDSKEAVRFLGVYNKQDWRAYTLGKTGAFPQNIADQSLAFYKLTSKTAGDAKVVAPKASIESGETVDFGTEVELSCSTEDAKIYYNLNGTENFSKYDGPIEITKDSTIYAYAVVDEEKSQQVSFDYKVAAGSKVTDITKLAEDQEFVLTFGKDAALSTTASKSKLEGVEVSVNDDNHLTISDEQVAVAKLKLVKAEEKDQFYLTSDILTDGQVTTKYLTTGSTGNSLTLEAEKNDYSLWSVEAEEDGSFLVKNVNAVYHDKKKDIDKPQYIEFYNKLFTTYSYVAGTDKKDAFLLNAYTAPSVEAEEPTPEEPKNTVAKLLTRELYDGDQVVIYYPAGKKLMTTEATNNGKLKDVAVEVSEDGTVETKDTNAAVLTVATDDNGNYSFQTSDGKFLTGNVEEKEVDGKKKTYANLILADEKSDNALWSQQAASDSGKYYLKNAYAKVGSSAQALEYYSGFSLYGFKEASAYEFSFYALTEGEKIEKVDFDKSASLAIAQWAGNAHYDEVETSKEYIAGDLYSTNDMLDKDAKFTAVVGGNASQPWTSAKSSNTGSINYYMGSTGVASESDYMQLQFSTVGYGNMSLGLRMRASNTAAGAFQLQYSTDGESFKNFKKGTYSYKYTAYKSTDKVDENGKTVQEPFEVSGSGDILDGIAKTSLAPTYYVTFKFDIPAAANNAEKLYVRFVPTGGLSAKGDKAPAKGGVIRMDSVEVTGNPVVSDKLCGYVKANPTSGDVAVGDKITLTSDTEDAEIFYSVNGGKFTKYDAEEKVELKTLPATLSAYATKDGLNKSITVNYKYSQAQVAAVKAAPNGGAVFEGQRVTLKTKTEGATILYRYATEEEVAKEDASEEKTEESSDSKTEEKAEEATSEEVVEHDDWITYTGSFELKELPAQLQVKAVKDGYLDSAVSTIKFTKKLNDKYNIYFGQVHAHTSISDGAGTLKDALEHASHVDNLDYIVITDHSNSIDNEKESKITENVDKADTDEWTYAHNLVKQYSTDKFTCAYGYEMTWSNGLGHMNTFNTPGFQSRTQTEFSTYATALQNYYAALRTVPDSISQFNHPGTTFGDFQDFAYYSEENDALITMIEVGNGEGTIGSSGYFPSYEYYTRALDKGWHVAPTNNQDNHKGKWGDANTARTVMLADTNDENAIYDAMRNYRIYATEDNDLSVYYTLDGNIMGSILEKDAVGDTVELKADIKDPTDRQIGKVEVIVNGGQSIAVENVNTNEETVTFNVPANYSYYYLKITEADGDIAVTAPVWVGEVEACGINKTYTDTVLPVAGEPLDINVQFYNNEKSELVIDDINIVLSDVDGNKTEVVNGASEDGKMPPVPTNSESLYSTAFTYDAAGQVTYEVTVHATLDGVKKTYTDKLTVSYALPSMVSNILIDGTHGNDYVTGYYGGNVSSFISLCGKKNIRATVEIGEITPEKLKDVKLFVISAPAKKSGTAGAGDYEVHHYSDEFIAMVKDYVANGGSVAICGLADYSDSTDCQTATEQNKLLEAIGATIRMGSDEVCDDTNNGGQVYRMYPTTFNYDSEFLAGVKDGQKYSQYSGCSVDISKAGANDVVDAAEWLVNGYDTTYSVDCKDANGKAQEGVLENGVKGKKNDNQGQVTFLARQKTKAGGNIFVAGGVFLSDFEVKAEIDNNDSLPFANYTIVNNILDGATVELPTTTIAEARKGKMNEVFAVEGYVTSGTDNENTTFFDTIYIQDETGGMDIFPYATPGLKIGTKMRIVGYLAQYQGDLELKVLSAKVLDEDPYVWAPKKVDTKTAMDYDNLGGQFLQTEGKVTRVEYNDDGTVSEFWLDDGSGSEAAIFIDGYITSASTGKNTVGEFVEVGATVNASGVLYMHPEGDSDVSVPVFRVRNCDDIVLVKTADGEDVLDIADEAIKQMKGFLTEEMLPSFKEAVLEQLQSMNERFENDPEFREWVMSPEIQKIAQKLDGFFRELFGW
ncbi:Chitobiase/beta-hexosaminidase C-terminal domain-containing protein [Pseudobutyrivibrio sp. YE44]|uniref:CehA/McbA family metallohydrolase n=1 Tax=Pseudobutyrivibrio sp. YE44 TaxID=1520802 RepID=UPI000891BE04|nr:CehA/McbA family metallohydrolase [Pseudobutyrivibrio sp. YE44]SDB22653.1 Chitobiase/beta-hexosaminidase C-terminal domain-containing protein [Pseudobutyrivibrio sp. YE44]